MRGLYVLLPLRRCISTRHGHSCSRVYSTSLPASDVPSPSPDLSLPNTKRQQQYMITRERIALERKQREELKQKWKELVLEREKEVAEFKEKNIALSAPIPSSEYPPNSALTAPKAPKFRSSPPPKDGPFYFHVRLRNLFQRFNTKLKTKQKIMYAIKEYKTVARMLKERGNLVAAKNWAAKIEEKAKAKEMAGTMTTGEDDTAEEEEGKEKDLMPVFQLSSEQKMYNLYKDHLLQILAGKREKGAFSRFGPPPAPLLITLLLSHISSSFFPLIVLLYLCPPSLQFSRTSPTPMGTKTSGS